MKNIEEKSKKTVILISLLVFCMLYIIGYPVARWRKCIVMREYDLKGDKIRIDTLCPGWDIRDSWTGKLKNNLNPVIFYIYKPLVCIENSIRGKREKI